MHIQAPGKLIKRPQSALFFYDDTTKIITTFINANITINPHAAQYRPDYQLTYWLRYT